MSAVVGVAPADTCDESVACPDYPPRLESLLGVLRYQQERLPGRLVCHRLWRARHGLISEPMTIEQLVARAARAAATLRAAGIRDGDRVILSLRDPHDFLVAFCGALAMGASAVPLPTLAESAAPRSFAARLRAVARDCEPSAAVVEDIKRFADIAGELPTRLTLLEPHALAGASTDAMINDLDDRPASSPAFIQYTSGSTGRPKGVVVTHENIMANCRAIRDASGYSRADRMVSWLPLHHDMGLVGGLLTSIYCAAETCLLPPLAFLARPVTWLEAITRCAASLTIGPTFAYGLCAGKISDKQLAGIDLSSLRLAYIGAEPIDPRTVAAFLERFVPYGLSPAALYPVYGLAEATLAVTFPQPGNAIRYDTVDRRRLAAHSVATPVAPGQAGAVTFVSVGHCLPEHRIEIVGRDTGRPLGERQVGELVTAGRSVTPGYFGARGAAPRQTLHTGDLAYIADGHCYIVDRIKDLVIIAGQNYAPSDIEGVAAQVSGVRPGRSAAFSASGPTGSEQLHIVAELAWNSWRLPKAIADDVRRAVRETIGLTAASVTIVAAGTLERTSSGKIKRRACAEAHRGATLAIVRARSGVLAYRVLRRAAGLAQRARLVLRGLADRLGAGGRSAQYRRRG